MVYTDATMYLIMQTNFVTAVLVAAKLDAIHSHVDSHQVFSGGRVSTQDLGEGDEGAAVIGPTF